MEPKAFGNTFTPPAPPLPFVQYGALTLTPIDDPGGTGLVMETTKGGGGPGAAGGAIEEQIAVTLASTLASTRVEEIERSEKAAEWLANQTKNFLARTGGGTRKERGKEGGQAREGDETIPKKGQKGPTDEEERQFRRIAKSKFNLDRPDNDEEDGLLLQHWTSHMEGLRLSGDKQGYFSIVERCFRTFTSQPLLFPSYRNHPEFLRICICYAKMSTTAAHDSPCGIFHRMYRLGIGTKQSLFWMEWGLTEGADMNMNMNVGALAGTTQVAQEEDTKFEHEQPENADIPTSDTSWSKKGLSSKEGLMEITDVGEVNSRNSGARHGVSEISQGWNTKCTELASFVRKNGHANIPRGYEESPNLNSWAMRQRKQFKENKLSRERLVRLCEIGFEFTPFRRRWDARYAELVAYASANGNANVPARYKQNRPLGEWVMSQRQEFKRGALSRERADLLGEIDFEFSLVSEPVGWDERYAELVAYAKENGNANVAQSYKLNPPLGEWVNRQRRRLKTNKLSREQLGLLNEIDFEFYPRKCQWNARYAELVAYAKNNGNANVPDKYKENRSLGFWVSAQRHAFRDKSLAQEKISLLNKTGFQFLSRSSSKDG